MSDPGARTQYLRSIPEKDLTPVNISNNELHTLLHCSLVTRVEHYSIDVSPTWYFTFSHVDNSSLAQIPHLLVWPLQYWLTYGFVMLWNWLERRFSYITSFDSRCLFFLIWILIDLCGLIWLCGGVLWESKYGPWSGHQWKVGRSHYPTLHKALLRKLSRMRRTKLLADNLRAEHAGGHITRSPARAPISS